MKTPSKYALFGVRKKLREALEFSEDERKRAVKDYELASKQRTAFKAEINKLEVQNDELTTKLEATHKTHLEDLTQTRKLHHIQKKEINRLFMLNKTLCEDIGGSCMAKALDFPKTAPIEKIKKAKKTNQPNEYT